MDIALLRFINITIANPAFDFIFKNIGDFHIWRWPLILIVIMILWKGGVKGRYLILISVLTIAFVDLSIHYILKPLFARLRPSHEEALNWLRLIDGRGGRFGFPSSHAANLFSQAFIIGNFYKSSRYYLYPLAALICISRVYLGVHYPSDVLAGAVYGALIGFSILAAAKAFAPASMKSYIQTNK